MDINEILYTIMNKPYFKVFVLSRGKIVKTFTQLAGAANGEDVEASFLLCRALKCAWWKPVNPVIQGLKFICYADIENAIPLKFEMETEINTTGYWVKKVEKITISEDIVTQRKNWKNGKPDTLVDIPLPPDLLFEQLEAVFVRKVLTPPPDKFDFLKNKWIIIGIIGLFAFWYLSNGGKII